MSRVDHFPAVRRYAVGLYDYDSGHKVGLILHAGKQSWWAALTPAHGVEIGPFRNRRNAKAAGRAKFQALERKQ